MDGWMRIMDDDDYSDYGGGDADGTADEEEEERGGHGEDDDAPIRLWHTILVMLVVRGAHDKSLCNVVCKW